MGRALVNWGGAQVRQGVAWMDGAWPGWTGRGLHSGEEEGAEQVVLLGDLRRHTQ